MRRLRTFLIALVPVLLALGIGFILEQGYLENPVLIGEYRIDTAGVVSRIGILTGVIIFFILVTFWWAEERAENTLRAEKIMQTETRLRFFRRLDHELKNPLAIIKVGIFNLKHSSNLTDDQHNSLDRVGQQTERIQKLVQDLRWLTELEEYRVEQYPVDLEDVINEAADLIRNTHVGRVLNLNIQQVPWSLAAVSGDRDMLVLVFRNLLDNAFKYSNPGDHVEVRASDDGYWATIEVADTGKGISEDDMPRIFEELYRGGNAQDIDGSGLGLALVWRIVKLHGGDIGVRSRAGQGTVVCVRLKLAPQTN